YEVSSLAFEFSGKDTTLLGHLTPRYGEHSRLNECPVSLDHYKQAGQDGGEAVHHANGEQEVLDHARAGEGQTVNGLQAHKDPFLIAPPVDGADCKAMPFIHAALRQIASRR
ncbi:hypothetical protein, partial [Pseudomonas lundensis]|uniref:hypothetical protein n=1 Tax=Pseudomonas lundensis TaxID=86185 RepID=UPI003B97D428